MSADLEREAREAAVGRYTSVPDWASLGAAKQWELQDRERHFEYGYIAAATLREKEIAYLSDARSRELQVLVKYLRQIKERDAEIATLRARVAELELEVEITAREALDRIAELEGMVPKWVWDDEEFALKEVGWRCVGSKWVGSHTAHYMTPPPIPVPETKP